jgi:hypothetical protein
MFQEGLTWVDTTHEKGWSGAPLEIVDKQSKRRAPKQTLKAEIR